jgi:L-ribulose-5-phosphate 3-epimerase
MLISRRQAIKLSLLQVSAATTWDFPLKKPRFQLGACDWSLGKTMDPGAFDVAKQIGLQGVQLSYNRGDDAVGLSNPATLNAIKAASSTTGVKISSLAIGELNNVPYKSDSRTEEWVWNSVDVASRLGVKVILLAFFGKGDLRNDEQGKKEVIRRLKKVAPHAEKKGVVLGLETYLSAEEHLDIIQAVGSKSVRVYYDFRNAADAGHDIYKEIPLLGKEMICELHMKENGKRLGEGTLDWPRIAGAVMDMGYKGWMQIEWANSTPDIVACYQHNRQYLSRLFPF